MSKILVEKNLTQKKTRENRSDRRNLQVIDSKHNIRTSLQSSKSISENREKLQGLLYSYDNYKFEFRSLLGLISVLDNLECATLLPFQNAYEIYSSFFEHEPDKYAFRDRILDSDKGILCCYFFHPLDKKAYLALRLTEIPVEKIIQQICGSIPIVRQDEKLSSETVYKVLKSMDTEYDKQCAKALLVSNNYTEADLYTFGINPQTAKNHINRIIDIVEECEKAEIAANDIVQLRLDEKIQNLEKRRAIVDSCFTKTHTVTEHDQNRMEELMQDREDLQTAIQEQTDLKESKTKYHRQKLQQAIKRTAEDLIDKNRIKRRKLGAGPNEKIDEEDEEFLLNCMETKATAHGRRHDSVLYLNHTVRKADFKNIVNHFRVSHGKQPIKSSTTAYNRSKPKSIRSTQAKRHRGKWLFSCKKPTKSEEKYRIHTKHQRAHVKRAVTHLCKSDKELSLIHSMDDKAYLKPEASDGLDKFKVFQTTDKSKQRQLPKYDFAQAKLNITPSSHRYFMKEIVGVDQNVELVMTEDENICVFRPKFYLGSSGSVWASEDMRLRYEKPEIYEIPTSTVMSNDFHKVAAVISDKTNHFLIQTVPGDFQRATSLENCPFQKYEQNRLKSLIFHLDQAELMLCYNLNEKSETEKRTVVHVYDLINIVRADISNVKDHFKTKVDVADLTELYNNLIGNCSGLLKMFDDLHLRKIKPRVLELTDAGPGVGKSNRDVRFRAAEKVLIQNLDFYSRIHRATGDCQNEVERTQSAVGKAISDGGSIHWEYKSLDINSEEVKNMSLEELESFEDEINRHNVSETCKDLALRVQSSPGPRGGFMMGLVSNNKGELFFNDEATLKEYLDTAQSKKHMLPGYNYYRKILDFYEKHFEEGELYMEYVKFKCEENLITCEHCAHGWSAKPITVVPRPYPDANYKYKCYEETPTLDMNEIERKPDDFQPRSNIRSLFEDGELKSGSPAEDIKKFGQKFAVQDESLILAELNHMENIKFKREKRSDKRKRATQEEKCRSVDEYDWQELLSKGKIKELSVNLLSIFIRDKKLCHPIPRKKSEKISLVEAYLSRQNAMKQCQNRKSSEKPVNESESDEENDLISDMSEDEINIEIGSDVTSDSDDDTTAPPVAVNRFGRSVSHWKHRKFYGDSDSDDE